MLQARANDPTKPLTLTRQLVEMLDDCYLEDIVTVAHVYSCVVAEILSNRTITVH